VKEQGERQESEFQNFRISGVQNFRSSEFQEFRISGVQESVGK